MFQFGRLLAHYGVLLAGPRIGRGGIASGAATKRILYLETMSNPTLRVADIPRLAKIAHASGAKLVVDNTFCPLIVSP
jgi:cystathionine beta-lyase/cystathionine gamma-synthase